MKKAIVFIAAVFFAAAPAAFAGQLVSEKPLLEKLREKGLLTGDDINAIEKDNGSAIELGGLLQTQYRTEGKDTGPAAPGAHAAWRSGFLVKTLRLEVKANLSKYGYAKVETAFAGTTGWDKLNDAFIAFLPASGLNLYAGQKKVPFSWEELTSTKNLSFIESGYASQIGIGRQLGLEAEYFLADGKIALNAGIYNGNADTGAFGDRQLKKQRLYSNRDVSGNDNGGGNLLAARAEFHPFGYVKKGYENFERASQLAVGVSYYTSDDRDVKVYDNGEYASTFTGGGAGATTAATKALWLRGTSAWGADLIYRYGGLELAGELASRKLTYAYDGTSASFASATEQSTNQTAFQAGATYLVTDSLALGARYEAFNYGDDAKLSNGGPVKAKEDRATTLGVSWYLKKHTLKVQANYILKDEAYSAAVLGSKEKASNDVFVVQAAYAF